MAGGGGAWKVAYADFVTAMMAFFMVMWLTAQSPEVKKAIGGYFQDPWGTSAENSTPTLQTPAGLTGNVPFADSASGILPNRWPQANQDNATEKQPGAASVWQQKQKVFLMTTTDRNLPALVVNFGDSSAELTPASEQRLNDLLPALVGKQNRIELRAHSTRRPLPKDSTFRDHWQLCYERSLAVMKFLVQHSVEPERVRLSQAAAFEPLTTRLESSFQDENNCVEVFLLTETSGKTAGTTPVSGQSADAVAVAKPKP
ncbi:MAG TPA: flagellar motor protein MotB [Lacipirellulaceae bacterium]|jgi:chemotaxis protein MotB|nr:flagellar motor protein MotB [Lacipirellulaceae bacterium]